MKSFTSRIEVFPVFFLVEILVLCLRFLMLKKLFVIFLFKKQFHIYDYIIIADNPYSVGV